MPWLAGETLLRTVPGDPSQIARDLAAFLRALHQPAPADAPPNPWRGVPLAARTPQLDGCLERVGGSVDQTAVLAFWQEAITAAPWRGPAVWIHGDLHPRNLLVAGGRLSAVIDFGDVTSGDPATDLSIGWMLPPPFRLALREAIGDSVDDATWRRARGWALTLGLAYVTGSKEGDPLIALGCATVAAALGSDEATLITFATVRAADARQWWRAHTVGSWEGGVTGAAADADAPRRASTGRPGGGKSARRRARKAWAAAQSATW